MLSAQRKPAVAFASSACVDLHVMYVLVAAEIHFNITEMREDFKESGKIRLSAVVNELHDFRKRGLRIHYWP